MKFVPFVHISTQQLVLLKIIDFYVKAPIQRDLSHPKLSLTYFHNFEAKIKDVDFSLYKVS